LLDQPHVRFSFVAPDLVNLSDESAQPLDLPTRGALLWTREADGLHLRVEEGRTGRVRWDLATGGTIDRVRVRGTISVAGVADDAPAAKWPTLFILQRGGERTKYRMVARWHRTVEMNRFDRVLVLPDPSQPLRLILNLPSSAASLVIHRLTIDGLADRPWIEILRWCVLAGWLILIVTVGERLTRPMDAASRTRLWWTLAVLVAGLLAPPEMIETIRTLLAELIGPWSPDSSELEPNMLGHFVLFGLLAMVAFQGRADLGLLRMSGLLIGLAIATELMQHLVDGRQADWQDVVVDGAGIGVGVLLLHLAWRFGWIRRPAGIASALDQDRFEER
jgi:VanZ family protein